MPRRSRALLVVLAGLPGTGKSTVAKAVAEALDAVWLRVDTIEAAILRSGVRRSFATGLAAYVVAHDLAEVRLRLGGSAVIDAVNGVEPARRIWRSLARRTGARLRFVEVRCPDPNEHRRRLRARGRPTPPLPRVTWAQVVATEYRPWSDPVLTLDTTEPPVRSLARVLRYCRTPGRPAPTRRDPRTRPPSRDR